MGKGKIFFYIIIAAFSGCAGKLSAQVHRADSLVHIGDSLRTAYRFEESVQAYAKALETPQDTSDIVADSLFRLSVNDRILLSENGRNMAGFAYSPVVVAKHKFSLDDFWLYYPLKDKAWRDVPNCLDSLGGHRFARSVYVPEGSDRIFYSAPDSQGIRNIYVTSRQDSLWTVPSLLNEHTTSASDEIFPMLSPDGKALYFASEGLYGVGGYDLYVSMWDDETKDWSVPVNLGFPYSSPADDFLLVNTDDGKYTIFASNRDCSADSVCVYVLEYDSMPVRRAVDDPAELCRLASLVPSADVKRMESGSDVNTDIPENMDTRRYMDKMAEVRALRDSIALHGASLENERNRFALSNNDEERVALTNEILRREALIPVFQDSLDRAVAGLQKIELEFLFNGVVIDPDKLLAEADREIVGEATAFTFSKMSSGDSLALDMMVPREAFDYSFMVLAEGRFAEDNTIPPGVIYQIQIYGGVPKLGVHKFRGLSPIFEHRMDSGTYAYRVGLFRAYKDVLANLNAVKKLGFRSAFIVAFIDGEQVSVAKARAHEAESGPAFYEVRIVPLSGELDAVAIEGITQQSAGKDVARGMTEDGTTVYVVGLFDDKGKAEALADFVRGMGLGTVSCQEVKKDR